MADFGSWLRQQFGSVFAWFKHDEARFDDLAQKISNLHEYIECMEESLVNQLLHIFQELKTMSAQTDALTAEVDKVVAVLESGDALLKASADAQAHLQSHLAGDALDSAAVQAATEKLAAARSAFEADVAKLSPAATGTGSGASTTTEAAGTGTVTGTGTGT